jgi:hypothetical protein
MAGTPESHPGRRGPPGLRRAYGTIKQCPPTTVPTGTFPEWTTTTWPSMSMARIAQRLIGGGLDHHDAILVGFIAGERIDLRRIEHAAFALILLANQRLITAEHGIFRLRHAER